MVSEVTEAQQSRYLVPVTLSEGGVVAWEVLPPILPYTTAVRVVYCTYTYNTVDKITHTPWDEFPSAFPTNQGGTRNQNGGFGNISWRPFYRRFAWYLHSHRCRANQLGNSSTEVCQSALDDIYLQSKNWSEDDCISVRVICRLSVNCPTKPFTHAVSL